jgi:hypothetical protein
MKKFSVISLIFSLLFILSCEDKVEKDTTPPELTIVSPTSGSTIGEIVQIKVQTTDESGILKVDFYIQNSIVLSDTTLPYEYEWNTTTNLDGEYKVKVVSFDTEENFVESEFSVTVDNESKKPSVSEIDSLVYKDNSFVIYWSKNNDSDFKSYNLFISEDSMMSGKQIVFETNDRSQNSYTMSNVENGIYRFFQLITKDSYNLESSSQVKEISSFITFTMGFGNKRGSGGLIDGDNYVMIGRTTTDVSDESDLWIVKLDRLGGLIWENNYGGNQIDEGIDIIKSNGGDYFIIGTSGSFEIGEYVYVLKINGDGQLLWEKSYKGSNGSSIIEVGNNKFIFLSDIQNSFNYSRLTEINENGEVTSTTDFTKNGKHVTGEQIIKSNDDKIILSGSINGSQGYLVKYSSTMNFESELLINSMTNINSMIMDSNNDILVIGNSGGGPNSKTVLTMTSSNSEIIWTYVHNTNSYSVGYSVVQTSDGNFVFCGQNIFQKIDNNGNVIWDHNQSGNEIIETKDGGFIIFGGSLIKTNSVGKQN